MYPSLPNQLTWGRIFAIPALVAIYYVPDAWLAPGTRNLLATGLFITAALTDLLDGWLARRFGTTSAFGAFLDPVADKLIVAAALILLVHLGRLDALVATIIIGREITISALREWMAQLGASRSVAVSMLGKVKTAAQMVAIPLLLYEAPLPGGIDTVRLGTVLIWVAAVLTLWSMAYYLQRAQRAHREMAGQGQRPAP